jgi:SAM-dependent methyltransferase
LSPIGLDIPVLNEKQVIGAGIRPGGCYNCGSTDRDRLVYIYLKEKLKIFDGGKDKSILHIAPENILSNKLLEFGFSNYVCGDLFAEGYKYPDHVQNMNLLNLPFDENTFDLMICNHVLEHIPNDLEAMKEIHRVLKFGGQAILQVPISKNSEKTLEDFTITDPKEREHAFGQFDHVRIYGQDYVSRLTKSGFKVNRVNISQEYENYGLNINEDLFIAIKEASQKL